MQSTSGTSFYLHVNSTIVDNLRAYNQFVSVSKSNTSLSKIYSQIEAMDWGDIADILLELSCIDTWVPCDVIYRFTMGTKLQQNIVTNYETKHFHAIGT